MGTCRGVHAERRTWAEVGTGWVGWQGLIAASWPADGHAACAGCVGAQIEREIAQDVKDCEVRDGAAIANEKVSVAEEALEVSSVGGDHCGSVDAPSKQSDEQW